MRNLEILVTVVDKTQKPLDDVQKRIRKTGEAAKSATIDITKFNRGLFSATAVAATFTRAFIGVGRAISEGADWDRLTSQVDRVLGPSGKFLDAITKTTDIAIDKTEALKAGLSLANLGIAKDVNSIANIIAKAGVAAKMAGKDSAEGIRSIAEFIKTGNISQLQNLDLLHEANLAYKTQQAVLGKVGGALGGVISLQHRLALGQALLDAKTKNQLTGFTDIKDVVKFLSEEYTHLRKELGVLLGKAILPLAKGLTKLIISIRQVIQNVRESKEVQFFAKSLLVASAAVTALVGTFATLKGVMFALTSIGFGLPKLITLTLSLGSAFLGITAPIKTVEEKLKVLGAIFKGTWELITTFDSDTGLAKMSKATYELLKQNGLLGFVQFLGRAGRLVYVVANDIWSAFKWLGKKVDDTFGGIARTIFDFFNIINTPWKNWFLTDKLDEANKALRALLTTGGALLAIFGGKKLFGALGSILGKIPGIGKLFGGGGGPSGSASDPIYTVSVGGMASEGMSKVLSGVMGFLGKWLGGIATNLMRRIGLGNFVKAIERLGLGRAILAFAQRLPILGTIISRGLGLFGSITGTLASTGSLLMKLPSLLGNFLMGLAPMLGPALGVAAAAAAGIAIGSVVNALLDKYTQGKTEEGFEGNAAERGLFKLSKWTGIGPAREFIDNQEKMRRNEEAALKRVNEIRKRQGKLPVSSLEEIGQPTETSGTVPQLFTPINQPGQPTATTTPLPSDYELEMLDKLGQSLVETPNSYALTMQKEYEKMLNSGMKPSQIVADKLANKLDDTNYLLEGILKNTAPQNKTLMRNPMEVSR